MIWIDFLEKIKQYSLKVTTDLPCIIIEGIVDGEKRHVSEYVENLKGPIDTQDVTRILIRFKIQEMFFHD